VYVAEYMSGIIYHFQDLHFGEGVEQVVYHIVGGDSVFLFSFGEGTTYGKKNKNIGNLFKVHYETIQSLEGEVLLKYVSQQVIEETNKFTEKKIKRFDFQSYIKSLEEYFALALQVMRKGKNPAEGKVLNEDIQLAITKKWSRL
jgi:hypothetical protein